MKKVILTFDDGPSEKFRERVDFLLNNNGAAIFFCCGKNLENPKYRKDLIYAVKKGIVLGNHTYSHIFLALNRFSKIKKEISETEKIIDEIYFHAKVDRKEKLIRFPYFSSGGFNFFRIERFLKIEGFQNPYFKKRYFNRAKSIGGTWHFIHSIIRNKYEVYCDIDTKDWHPKVKFSDLKKLLKRVKDRDVICLHDKNHNLNLDKKIILDLKKKGFKFKF